MECVQCDTARKVFFDIMFYYARQGREGLRALCTDSFIIEEMPDGREYVQLHFHPATKAQQGSGSKGKFSAMERNVMVSHKGDPNFPVLSLCYYLGHLHPKQKAF